MSILQTAIGLSLPIKLGPRGYFDTNLSTIDQVKTNIVNILKTRPGERRFNNKFGSSLYSLLFEQMEADLSKNIIIDAIQRDINRFLNGVYINNVTVSENNNYHSSNNDGNAVFINVIFTYNGTTSNVNVNIEN